MKKMYKRAISFVLAGAMGLSLTGCSNPLKEYAYKLIQDNLLDSTAPDDTEYAQNPKEQPTTEAPIVNGVEVINIRRSFGDHVSGKQYEIVTTPNVPAYEVNSDFSNVINADMYQYTLENNENFKNKLLENGFVVTEGYEDEFFSLYENNRYNYVPNFITTDAMVHTYHLYFAHLLKTLEQDYFYNDLLSCSKIMINESMDQYNQAKGTEFEAAALRNVAYFTVAAKLLDPDTSVEPAVADIVNQELTLIENASGITESPLMLWNNPNEDPIKEDYSQYKVRGYYTETTRLSSYFKTMMWFGRLSFRMSNDEETKSALLITKAMQNKQAILSWSNVYDVTSFFMGNSDDPGIYDYYGYMDAIYGQKSIAEMANDKEAFEEFSTQIKNIRMPAINSIPVRDNQTDEERTAAIQAFRFMGQRETFDADAFQQLIYSNVTENSNGNYRMLPSAMDIPAVFGSETAEEILREDGAYDYGKYEDNMNRLKSVVPSEDDKIWKASLYNNWLHMIRPLTLAKGEGYPQFMQNDAWTKKQLNTFLGSFTELKHDSVLYAKQVYAEMGGGPEEERDDRGYVEPEPMLYARLSDLTGMTRDGLKNYNMISDEDIANLDNLQLITEQLLTISNKELKNEPLSSEEYEFIKTFGGQLEHFWYEALKDQAVDGYLSTQEHPAAVVTDIATDPNGQVLEIGTGRIDTIYVIVNVEGSLRIAEGCVFSYYEFAQPLENRLTDKEWRVLLGIDFETDETGMPIFEEKDKIPQPSWIDAFKIPSRY